MPVRIVEVPGVDLCACCAPHVSFTGEIGLVRLKDRMRHRGGVRFTMLAGRAAYEDAALCAAETESLSRLFSAPQNALCSAAERVLGELERGVTLFETVGAFSGERSQTMLCVLRRTQVGALRAIIRETDPQAFVIAADVSEVMGEGFGRLGG